MLVKMYTASGEEHGLVDRLANSVQSDEFKHFKADAKKEMLARRAEDSKIVKAQYLNSRSRQERLETAYCKYPGDPIELWKFIPGYNYDVPMGLVKQINDKNKIPKKRADLLSEDSKPVSEGGRPLASDCDGDWLHKMVPSGFEL